MSTPSYGTAGGPGGRSAGLIRALGNLLAPTPAPTPVQQPAADDMSALLDRWSAVRPATNGWAGSAIEPAARAALARLTVPGGAAVVTPDGWQALARAYMAADPAGRATLSVQLSAAGVSAMASDDGRYVSFRDATVTAIAEPATGRLRVQRPGRAECYEGATLLQTLTFQGGQVVLEAAWGTEVWDAGGTGTFNGQPIAPRPAPRVPGEPPRSPYAALPGTNELDEPDWDGTSTMQDYGPEYDAAIMEAGGQVVEAYQAEPEADVYNCHSFATTGGLGDLFDPFMRNGQPHWLDNPMRQLSFGPYGRLAPDQRVHPGDVVVYAKDGQITHTGVVVAVDRGGNPTRIESKFGTLGLYVHDVQDVSELYGAPAAFYRPSN